MSVKSLYPWIFLDCWLLWTQFWLPFCIQMSWGNLWCFLPDNIDNRRFDGSHSTTQAAKTSGLCWVSDSWIRRFGLSIFRWIRLGRDWRGHCELDRLHWLLLILPKMETKMSRVWSCMRRNTNVWSFRPSLLICLSDILPEKCKIT